jgi:hypothetical protein
VLAKSPSAAASELFDGKYAWKRGSCQCVQPGMITRSRSARIDSKGSPSSGGVAGNAARTDPGATRAMTGRSPRVVAAR